MKIFTAQQIRDWDAATIQQEPISSFELMNRASFACVEPILEIFAKSDYRQICVVCGNGNNGGDGLAIARILYAKGLPVEVFMLSENGVYSPDCERQLKRIQQESQLHPHFISKFPRISFHAGDLIVDALFGTGINRALSGLAAEVVEHMNLSDATIVSIDMPSGLPADIFDASELNQLVIVEATYTLSIQVPKKSFFFKESARFVGDWKLIPIGLLPDFEKTAESKLTYQNELSFKNSIRLQNRFSHKGSYGHACIISGSMGMGGAALLAGKAALRAGVGLLTLHIPKVLYTIIQTALPEAMVHVDDHLSELSVLPNLDKFSAIGIGPGLGKSEQSKKALSILLSKVICPIVIDADALNLCAELMKENANFKFPKHAILTPHPKELERLVGHAANSYDLFNKAVQFAHQHEVIIVLKGAYTRIIQSDYSVCFNGTGNSLLSTAGTGDVLCGMICGLLAQGINPYTAAKYAVYVHGKCADVLHDKGRRTALASDIIEEISYLI
ncbi:MAG: NAD(P)H-hydrate dehydratase [Bacteroidia bacterium]